MIEALVGNRSAEKVLFYLQAYGEGYASGMAAAFGVRLTSIQQQLRRLEDGDIVVSRLVGRTRLYQFNPRCHYLAELQQLLERALQALPKAERERYYGRRTAPATCGKAVMRGKTVTRDDRHQLTLAEPAGRISFRVAP